MSRAAAVAATFRRRIWNGANAPAVLAIAVIVFLGIMADGQNRTIHQQDLRSKVAAKLSLIRTRIEGEIGGDVQLVRGLVAVLATQPSLSSKDFNSLAATLMVAGSNLRDIAAAPDLVVEMVYPLVGNEGVLGLRYLDLPYQRDEVVRARDSGKLVLSGPLRLVQGGEGMIARFPVFNRAADGTERFWGLLSAVLDFEKLRRNSGLAAPDLGLEIAILGRNGRGGSGELFHGKGAILAQNPVVLDVRLPEGTWRLAAVPQGGWDQVPPNGGMLHGLFVAAGLLLAIPLLAVGHLNLARRRHVEELSQRGEDLARLSGRLELALKASDVGVWEMDTRSGALIWDARMYDLYGVESGTAALDEKAWLARLHPEDRPSAVLEFKNAIRTKERYFSRYRIWGPDGTVRTMETVGAVFTVRDREKIVGVTWDATRDVEIAADLLASKQLAEARTAELEGANRRIEYVSLHDALTGLPNRRFLTSRLAAMRSERSSQEIALLHIDLDRFKQINDTFGHPAGDAMLLHATKVMCRVFRPGDFVARTGGDEFVAICLGDSVETLAAELAGRLVEDMQQPVYHEGRRCRLSVSIGIACSVEMHSDFNDLLANADIALYRAKAKGRSRYSFFTAETQSEVRKTKQLADEILSGIEQNQFVAFYQAQVDARTQAVVGLEALVRWHHPTDGLLAPDRFLRVAEEAGSVAAIDRAVLQRVWSDRRAWQSAGLVVPPISVNVSMTRLADEGLLAEVASLNAEPGALSFELLESIYLDGPDETGESIAFVVDALKDHGVRIEIDDFGTGHASIVSLMRLKPDRLKIARQLISSVVESEAQQKLVRSIVEIGQAFEIGIVAEGVETLEQATLLCDLGCDVLQGYVFARPVSAESVVNLLDPVPHSSAIA